MGIWKLSSIRESGNTLLSYVRGEVRLNTRLIYVLVLKALHMVLSPKNCWSLTGMFPCNLQGVSVAGSSCTAWEDALERFELDVLGQPLVAASSMSKLNFRPVSAQPDFEELLDSPSFTSLKGQSPVGAHCFLQLGRAM